jgi:WD repeat-containing protein 19
MVRGDWSQCPSCKFPALLSHARELSKKIKNCPICDEATRPSELIAIKPVLNMGEDNVPINDVVGGLTSS